MDNMLFWKILKSVFGSESDDFKRKIDYMLSWDHSIINNDKMIKLQRFILFDLKFLMYNLTGSS